MSIYTVPESVRGYSFNPAIKTAIDLLLDKNSDNITHGMQWDELPDFYKSYIAAHQTKAEYALMIFELWKNVWGEVIKSNTNMGKFKKVQRHDHIQGGGDSGCLSQIWDEQTGLDVSFELQEEDSPWYQFAVDFPLLEKGPRLSITFAEREMTERLMLGSPWKDGLYSDDYRITSPFPVDKKTGAVDLRLMTAAASEAVKSLLNSV